MINCQKNDDSRRVGCLPSFTSANVSALESLPLTLKQALTIHRLTFVL